MIGTQVGPYRVLDKIGAGGMGEVYRAADTRLDREVAIKVLPGSVADDPERLARFEREAKAIAALSHPNILAIFDYGVDPGPDPSKPPIAYTVTELLDGQTLRERLADGALPLRKAVEIAGQIARGLAAAHDRNIIHRDLKPENVFLLGDGQVKILDFGLARHLDAQAAGADSSAAGDSQTELATNPGTVLGTIGYMSPEQVRGHATDARSDLFALGTLLYEMLSGQRAFEGETAADTMTAILKEDPAELSAARADLPPSLDRIVHHCLEKNPTERFQTARDVAFALEALTDSRSGSGVVLPADIAEDGSAAARPASRVPALLIVGALAAGLAVGYGLRGARGASSTSVTDVSYQPVTFDEGFVFAGRFAQDGRTIVYSADWEGQERDVFVTSLDSPDSRPLGYPGSDLVAVSATNEIGVLSDSVIPSGNPYVRRGTLSRASLTGTTVRPEVEDVMFADFAPDGTMAVVRDGPLRQLEFPAGTVIAEAAGFVTPRISPDGRHVAVFWLPGNSSGLSVRIYRRDGTLVTESRPFVDWWSLAWSPAGDVWFAATDASGRQAGVFAMNLEGEDRLVYRAPGSLTLHDVSAQGDLLASFDDYRARLELWPAGSDAAIDRSWRESPRLYGLSEDGSVLFNQTGDSGGRDGAFYIWRLDADEPVKLGDGLGLALSADGSRALARTAGALSIVPTGVGQASAIQSTITAFDWSGFLSRDRLWFSAAAEGGRGVFALTASDGAIDSLLPANFSVGAENPVSPDGTRIAAWNDTTNELVVCEVATGDCRPVPGVEPGEEAAGWAADNRSLFVVRRASAPVDVTRVDITSGRRTLWRTIEPREAAVSGIRGLFVAPDGTLAFHYSRSRTQLYVIRGLR